MSGWIKLHRSLLEWEWYGDINATRLLIHLLVSVNFEDKKWKGVLIKAGSMAFSWETLSKACGLTVQQVRTAMDKLEHSSEVTREVTGNFQLVSLVKWEKLQEIPEHATGKQQHNNRKITANQQEDNRPLTTTKEYKEGEEGKNLRIEEKKEGVVFPFSSSEFLALWDNWKIYKKKEFRFSYRSVQSEQGALMKLNKLSGQKESLAMEIIMQSIGNGWQGFFKIKTDNGKQTTDYGKLKADSVERMAAIVRSKHGNGNQQPVEGDSGAS